MVMKLTVKKAGINGEGIAYRGHQPVFIDGVLPGETVLADIIQDNNTYAKASLQKVLTRSESRVRPACACQKDCGGCPLMIADAKAQANIKTELLAEALYKYGNVKRHFIRAMRPSPDQTGYRNQFKLPVRRINGKLMTGMFSASSNRFVEVQNCPVHDPNLEQARKAVLKVLNRHDYPEWNAKTMEGLRYLVMRIMPDGIQCTLVTGRETIGEELCSELMTVPKMKGVFQSIQTARKTGEIFGTRPKLLKGSDHITVSVNSVDIPLSPQAFFQLNTQQALQLYETAVSKIDPCDVLVEAYCGVGAMSLMAADKAKQIIGIESVNDAVTCAQKTAEKYGLSHISFICGDAAEQLRTIIREKTIDCLLIDPPRAGISDAMCDAILAAMPKKIIYVSCNPATLGKNLRKLKHAYHVVTVIPFDLFPQTPLIESVTVLEKG